MLLAISGLPHGQWKKGQSGNPRGSRNTPRLRALDIIDAKLAKQIVFTEAGRRRTATALEIILRQLWAKEVAGDRRAAAVLLGYRGLIPIPTGPPEFVIEESGYDMNEPQLGDHGGRHE